MRIETYFTIPEVDPSVIAGATVVVFDVIRATTTIAEALASGARMIYPTTSTEDAVKLAASMGREDTVLCGERRGMKVEGFDLGNSPGEFTPETVGGKKLVMSTTNGTRALAVGHEGRRVLTCAFTNLGAVARAVSDHDRLVAVCAGAANRFCLDDALCVGHLIERVSTLAGDVELNDASLAARSLAGAHELTADLLRSTFAGRALTEIGMGDDLEICAHFDRHDLVAEMTDGAITRSGD